MKRTALLVAALLSVPALALPASADSSADDVVVTAAVRTPSGGLGFRSRTATSEAAGQALADRWDDARGVVAADVRHRVSVTAVDTYRPLQWGLDTLHAEQSWTAATGAGVVVAVVDTGVQGDHPDLAGQVLPPIDVVEPSATRTVAIDPNGHGSHVAGIVAAAAGNGLGVAGLAPGARVLPVRVLDADGGGFDSDVAEGIVRAVDAGADVVNLSLGGPQPSDVLDAAVAYALAHHVVVVAAAGNEGLVGSPVEYPAAIPGVLAVGATDRTDTLAPFSSTGAFVDLVAPGVRIASTGNLGQYWYLDGTSMAAPFVSAAAALLLSAGVPAGQVGQRLQETAHDLGAPGRDDRYGAGLVDVVAALRVGAVPAVPGPVAAPAAAPVVSEPAPVVPAPGTVPAPVPAAPVPAAPVPAAPVPPAPVPAGPVPAVPAPAPAPVPAPPVAEPAPPAPSAPRPVPAPAPETPAPAPVAPVPVLRLTSSAAAVVSGDDVVLRVRALQDGRAVADVVTLERRTTTGWTALRAGRAGADGLVSWTVRPDRAVQLRARLGDVLSGVASVDVRQRVVATAGRGAVTGTVAPAAVGTVVVTRRTSTGWAVVSRGTTSSDGRYRLDARVARGTVLRVVIGARPGLLAGASAPVRSA